MRLLAVLATVIVGAGAALDIRDVLQSRQLIEQVDDMSDTVKDIEKLNVTLRAQRHDFLNHLQGVYSLMEMGEYEEANAYIERVYGDISAVSRVMKTASPAVNALLQLKIAAAEEQGISVHLTFRSDWQRLTMPAWEMCKVLSNLLDNALDALGEIPREERQLSLTLSEDLHTCRFSVSNTGPVIPPDKLEHIFQAGMTTKGDGHGMGLFIVQKTLEKYGGGVSVTSADSVTTFEGWVPKGE